MVKKILISYNFLIIFLLVYLFSCNLEFVYLVIITLVGSALELIATYIYLLFTDKNKMREMTNLRNNTMFYLVSLDKFKDGKLAYEEIKTIAGIEVLNPLFFRNIRKERDLYNFWRYVERNKFREITSTVKNEGKLMLLQYDKDSDKTEEYLSYSLMILTSVIIIILLILVFNEYIS